MRAVNDIQPKRYDVAELNEELKDLGELIDRAEEIYEQTVSETADLYLETQKSRRMILISGPSGSGKTTTGHRLADVLLKRGLDPVILSLDDFFLEAKKTPRDREGNPLYDSVQALDLSKVNRALWSLFYRGETSFSAFDFITGELGEPREVRLTPDSVVLIEGIHALNPLLTYGLDYDSFFKLCVHVESTFWLGEKRLLSAPDVRLLRRSIRDYRHRGASLDLTFRMWPGVREGELLYIRPFYPYADAILNTVYRYEPLLYKPVLVPLLQEVTGEYEEAAADLLARLEPFGELSSDLVPESSLLQEFIG